LGASLLVKTVAYEEVVNVPGIVVYFSFPDGAFKQAIGTTLPPGRSTMAHPGSLPLSRLIPM
jgi:hypothetical protein